MGFQISESDIKRRVKELAGEIYEFYKSKNLCEIQFIFIATSSFIFASDLIRELSIFEIKIFSEQISIRSYSGFKASKITLNEDNLKKIDLNGKVVLIVDDIFDTGNTLDYLNRRINELCNPLMVDYCCLMKKRDIKRKFELSIRFVGFEIPNVFVVGYGLDYNGLYRELPYITDLAHL